MAGQKRMTSASRLDGLESTVQGMAETILRIDTLSAGIFAKLEALNGQQTTPTQSVVQPEVFNYQTSALDSGKIVATNIEKGEVKTKGCFDVLEALMAQFPKGITVSAPHIKKDGSVGKSYILNLPRIDDTFSLCTATTKEGRLVQAKAFWKAVAFNGYMFTGMYRKAGVGSVFTSYIKQATEKPMLEWLAKRGVHIPKKDHNAPTDEAVVEE